MSVVYSNFRTNSKPGQDSGDRTFTLTLTGGGILSTFYGGGIAHNLLCLHTPKFLKSLGYTSIVTHNSPRILYHNPPAGFIAGKYGQVHKFYQNSAFLDAVKNQHIIDNADFIYSKICRLIERIVGEIQRVWVRCTRRFFRN